MMSARLLQDAPRSVVRQPATYLLLLAASAIGVGCALWGGISLEEVLRRFQWQVIAIYIALDLFSGLLMGTGFVEGLGLRLARWSRGRRISAVVIFTCVMFILSGLVNNLAAILVMLPVIFVLLKAMDLDQGYVNAFFALLLAVTNLGGASTPIGDFPALLIMSSGLTTFGAYLVRAWPLFFFTSIVLIISQSLFLRRRARASTPREEASRQLEIHILGVRHRYLRVDRRSLGYLVATFVLMFTGWGFLPPAMVPPEVTAVVGLGLGAVLVARRGLRPAAESFNLDAAIRISTFLFLAALASTTGILDQAAAALMGWTEDPIALLVTLMLMTAVMSGVFSAGPAAAAMLPVALGLVEPGAALQSHREWVAVAFAAAVCAGSSLFMWSATSGFLLADKVSGEGLRTSDGRPLTWGLGNYFKYGLLYFGAQLSVSIFWVVAAIYWGL